MPTYVLQFLAGPEAGRELPVRPGAEFVIGRSKSADITLNDSQASRRHARIFYDADKLMVEDLASANGTRVNGRKISRVELKAGDQIKIGEHGFKVLAESGVSEAAQEWWDQTHRGGTRNEEAVSGSLKSVGLVDLLQLLSNAGQTGTLNLRSQQQTGVIHLRSGQIAGAFINHRTALQPAKTLFRMLGWKTGRFEFGPAVDADLGNGINEPTSALLLDGSQETDKLLALGDDLPPLSAKLAVALPMKQKLRDLRPEELDLVQLIWEQETVLGVLDNFSGTDFDAYEGLLGLMKRGIVTVA